MSGVPFCAICTEVRPGSMRMLDGKRVFMCTRCETEHPRDGGYSFEPGWRPDATQSASAGEGMIQTYRQGPGRGASSVTGGRRSR